MWFININFKIPCLPVDKPQLCNEKLKVVSFFMIVNMILIELLIKGFQSKYQLIIQSFCQWKKISAVSHLKWKIGEKEMPYALNTSFFLWCIHRSLTPACIDIDTWFSLPFQLPDKKLAILKQKLSQTTSFLSLQILQKEAKTHTENLYFCAFCSVRLPMPRPTVLFWMPH